MPGLKTVNDPPVVLVIDSVPGVPTPADPDVRKSAPVAL